MTPAFILNAEGWHEPTNRYYNGRLRDLVLADTLLGDTYRIYFLGIQPGAGTAEVRTRPILRNLTVAKQCLKLGANLTREEVQEYESQLLAGGIPCRSCNGTIPGYRCADAEVGPFTTLARCMSCTAHEAAP